MQAHNKSYIKPNYLMNKLTGQFSNNRAVKFEFFVHRLHIKSHFNPEPPHRYLNLQGSEEPLEVRRAQLPSHPDGLQEVPLICG